MRVVRSILAGTFALALVVIMIPLPAAAIMPLTGCEQKCKSTYEEAAAVCGKMQNQADKRSCDDRGYAKYKRCGEDCELQRKKGECEDRCDKAAERCEAKCRKIPEEEKERRRLCWIDCNEENGRCKKDC
jgi:hypothetical protein